MTDKHAEKESMESGGQSAHTSKSLLWIGWILTGLVTLLLAFSAVLKLLKPAAVLEEFARLGYSERLVIPIGLLELFCALVYAIPRTSILGGILVAAYLGGATATHVRISDPFFSPVIAGALAWAGLYLRDGRVRALIPMRKG